MATHAEVAAHLFMSRQAVSEMFADGRLPAAGRGQADLDKCREAYIRHLRAVASGHVSGDGELDLTEERARLAKEQADRIELQNAQLRRELLPRADVDAAVTGAFARVRARLLAIPGAVAPVVAGMEAPQAATEVAGAIEEALNELADTSVADLCGDDDAVVDDPAAASAADGERMGGPGTEA